jgi:hypothetical protein
LASLTTMSRSVVPLMAGDGGDEVDQSGEQPDRKPPPTPEQTVAISFVDMFTQDAITKTPPASQVLQDQGFDPPAGNAELEAARDVVVTPFVIESEQQPMLPEDEAPGPAAGVDKAEHAAVDVGSAAADDLSPRSEVLPVSARTDPMDGVTPRGEGRLITEAMILRSTKAMRYRNEKDEAYLARISHLHLQSKRLRNLEKLDACVGLKCIYANGNLLTVMPKLEHQHHLTHLYLMDNAIRSMGHGPEVQPLSPGLQCLKLDQNELSCVENLWGLPHLETLSVANQRCPADAPPLSFDLDSLSSVGATLTNLNISGNGLVELMPIIHPLPRLKRLNASKNELRNLGELKACMTMLEELEECDFRKNPVSSTDRKYTRSILASSHPQLTTLDGEPVVAEHREKLIAIENFSQTRKRIANHKTPEGFGYLPAPAPGVNANVDMSVIGGATEHRYR